MILKFRRITSVHSNSSHSWEYILSTWVTNSQEQTQVVGFSPWEITSSSWLILKKHPLLSENTKQVTATAAPVLTATLLPHFFLCPVHFNSHSFKKTPYIYTKQKGKSNFLLAWLKRLTASSITLTTSQKSCSDVMKHLARPHKSRYLYTLLSYRIYHNNNKVHMCYYRMPSIFTSFTPTQLFKKPQNWPEDAQFGAVSSHKRENLKNLKINWFYYSGEF